MLFKGQDVNNVTGGLRRSERKRRRLLMQITRLTHAIRVIPEFTARDGVVAILKPGVWLQRMRCPHDLQQSWRRSGGNGNHPKLCSPCARTTLFHPQSHKLPFVVRPLNLQHVTNSETLSMLKHGLREHPPAVSSFRLQESLVHPMKYVFCCLNREFSYRYGVRIASESPPPSAGTCPSDKALLVGDAALGALKAWSRPAS